MSIYDNFADAAEYVDRARDHSVGRPVANNTRIIRRTETRIAIRLHQTDVITLYSDGDIEFSSGGWRTVTTKDRLNYNGRFSIYTTGEPYEWGVWPAGEWYGENRPKGRIFHDGIRFNAQGECLTDARTVGEVMAERAAEAAERKRTNGKLLAFSNRVAKAFREGMKANPLDCLPCRNRIPHHLSYHLEEGTIPASLIFTAIDYDPNCGNAVTVLGLHADPNGADILMGGQIERHYPTRAPRGKHELSTDRGRPDEVRRAVRNLAGAMDRVGAL